MLVEAVHNIQNSNCSVAVQAAPIPSAFNSLDFYKHVEVKIKEL